MSRLHKTHKRLISFLGLITIAVFGIISTLGTGGGGGDDGGVPPVTYTGLTTPAAVTSDNALLLGELAFMGVSAGTAITPIAVQSLPLDESRSVSVITIVRILHVAVNEVDVNSALSSIPIGWEETPSPLPGECGGTLSGSTNVNESTLTFVGNLVFDNWCNYGITMDGTVDFSGTCDADTFDPVSQYCEIIDYTMTFNTLNTSGYGVSETMDGTVASVTTSTGYVSTVNLLLRDDSTNKTYMYENYVITVTEDSPTIGYDTVVVTGNVYHPDYGFVVVTTPTPVQFYSDMLDSPPLSGVVLLTGADGTVGPTTAMFTFTGLNTFTVEADTDGDGGIDVTWSCDWDGNCSII
jgi:hypothetical protein